MADKKKLRFQNSEYYSYKSPNEYDFQKIFNQMSLLIENKSDLPKVNQIPYMIILWLPIKKETFYSQIEQSNIAQYLVGFIPKEPISNIKRLAKLNDPVSRHCEKIKFLKLAYLVITF